MSVSIKARNIIKKYGDNLVIPNLNLDIENGEAYSNLLLNSKLNTVELSDLDKAFVTKLVYGVITYKRTLDNIVSKLSKVKLKKISKPILNILRLGLYQIY